jgi:hypothetical protein
LNLPTTGQYFGDAVRDLVMACAAFSLAKLSEIRRPEGFTARQRLTAPLAVAR